MAQLETTTGPLPRGLAAVISFKDRSRRFGATHYDLLDDGWLRAAGGFLTNRRTELPDGTVRVERVLDATGPKVMLWPPNRVRALELVEGAS